MLDENESGVVAGINSRTKKKMGTAFHKLRLHTYIALFSSLFLLLVCFL